MWQVTIDRYAYFLAQAEDFVLTCANWPELNTFEKRLLGAF